METLNSPVYEVKRESDWYKEGFIDREDHDKFFNQLENLYGVKKGFVYLDSENFGVIPDTESYHYFKKEIVKNKIQGFYPIRKKSEYYLKLKTLIEQIRERDPSRPHSEFGENNARYSQWLGDRWFYEVKDESLVEGNDVEPIEYTEYLKVAVDNFS
ncbi:hypothetical protein [Bacillus safensis]|uniref:hypothetical protein n=1 Tax=Bacillus safensis TaxID=561879 RepID=UPI00090BCFA6|nr:hypothetical protein [Bacillus safensis]APJ11105.1 hypothetical protein BSL056_09100 [Bacillus safensis]